MTVEYQHDQLEIKARGVIIDDAGRVFLVRFANGSQVWGLPGGRLDFPEAVKVALHREMIEELGITPVLGQLILAQEFFRKDGSQAFDFWYRIENWKDFLNVDLSKASHGFEHDRAEFVDLETFEGILFPKQLKDWVKIWAKEGSKFIIGPGLE